MLRTCITVTVVGRRIRHREGERRPLQYQGGPSWVQFLNVTVIRVSLGFVVVKSTY